MRRKSPPYVPHNELDRLTVEANQYRPPKKTRGSRERCPHLQFYETKTQSGERYRKCQTCPMTQVFIDGEWDRHATPKD